MMFVNILLLA